MSEPIRTSRKDTAPTPQNTPAGSSAAPNSMRSAPMESINESNALSRFANDPTLLSLLEGKLGTLAGHPSGYIESLPAVVRTRVAGLKGLSAENSKIEAEFQRELLALEKKFYNKQKPLYELRSQIIAGEKEPSEDLVASGQELLDQEKEMFDDEEEDEEDEEDASEDETEENNKPAEVVEADSTLGVPDFWLVALKNAGMIADMISERDDEVLHYLEDIQVEFLETPGFALKFVFGDNPFFTNKSLTKTYFYQNEIGPTGEFVYDHAEGTDIKWTSPEQNVTVKVEKRKQRNKHTKQTRTVERNVNVDSFFTFFTPPLPPSDDASEDEYDDEIRNDLELDFDIGELIKVKIIPRAIDWYTGRALEYEGLTQEEEFDDAPEDDDEEEDDSEDGDEKQDPKKCEQQ